MFFFYCGLNNKPHGNFCRDGIFFFLLILCAFLFPVCESSAEKQPPQIVSHLGQPFVAFGDVLLSWLRSQAPRFTWPEPSRWKQTESTADVDNALRDT